MVIEWDKYIQFRNDTINNPVEWMYTKIECPICKNRIYRNEFQLLMTNPPQHIYKCFECGWEGSAF